MARSKTGTSPSPSSEPFAIRPWTIVGDPGDPRVGLARAALAERGIRPTLVDYRALLAGPGGDALSAVAAGALVRLESPGRARDLHLRLVALGAACSGDALALDEAARAVSDHGLIVAPGLWYRGLAQLMTAIVGRLDPLGVRYTSHPADVTTLFDKRACHARLAGAGLPVPAALPAPGSFEELRASMRASGWSAVFIKLRHGSAASGIVAYRRSPFGERAVTTVERVGDRRASRLYNTRRLRTLSRPAEIAELVDALCRHPVHVERWIPKAGLAGATFDLRVLVVAGEPAHAVVRLARGPITNLHLQGTRADSTLLRERMPATAWEELLDTCRRTGALFPRSLQVALDLAVCPGFRRHRVLEVNAFGDLLKGITYAGRTTYQAEVDAVCAGWGGGEAA
jgi:hypothetical protein